MRQTRHHQFVHFPNSPTRILVVRGGAIGDFILTLPVLAALRKRWPKAAIDVLGYPHIAELAVAGGLADAVYTIESPLLSHMFVKSGAFPESVAQFFHQFDLVISYIYDPDCIFQENVRRLSEATYLRGCHQPDEHAPQHATITLLEPLQCLGFDNPDPVPRLRIPITKQALDTEHAIPTLAVHPGSGSARKNWPEDSWVNLLDQLAKRTNCRLLMIAGEAEGQRADRLAGLWPKDRLKLARNLSLTRLAELLQSASAFVGHDSGITHLAAALGVETLALWGPTAPSVWRPLGANVTLLANPGGISALEVEAVLDACLKLIQKTPA
ncbi:MAG: glycosyltransferase family 9 protein [Verrucomicrobiota bacterium]|nr:glycosyltransferase family 9 protein [Verrucomicrobiota bacterium]